jgi:hypothetical protein
MGDKPRMMHTPAEEPGKPMSTARLAVSMKRYQRSCAALRASRLLIRLSRIGMARGRALLEQQASKDGRPGEQSHHERGAESWAQWTEPVNLLRDQQLRIDLKGLAASRRHVGEPRQRSLRVALEAFDHEFDAGSQVSDGVVRG